MVCSMLKTCRRVVDGNDEMWRAVDFGVASAALCCAVQCSCKECSAVLGCLVGVVLQAAAAIGSAIGGTTSSSRR